MDTQQATTDKKPREKRPIDILRERHGGMSKELQEAFKLQNKVQKGIKEQLRAGAKTVPELACALSLPAELVLWHLMAIKKYGEIVDAGERGDYLVFAWKEGE